MWHVSAVRPRTALGKLQAPVLERMESCQALRRGIRRRFVSVRCGWGLSISVSTSRSGPRSCRSPRRSAARRRPCGAESARLLRAQLGLDRQRLLLTAVDPEMAGAARVGKRFRRASFPTRGCDPSCCACQREDRRAPQPSQRSERCARAERLEEIPGVAGRPALRRAPAGRRGGGHRCSRTAGALAKGRAVSRKRVANGEHPRCGANRLWKEKGKRSVGRDPFGGGE